MKLGKGDYVQPLPKTHLLISVSILVSRSVSGLDSFWVLTKGTKGGHDGHEGEIGQNPLLSFFLQTQLLISVSILVFRSASGLDSLWGSHKDHARGSTKLWRTSPLAQAASPWEGDFALSLATNQASRQSSSPCAEDTRPDRRSGGGEDVVHRPLALREARPLRCESRDW